MDDLNSSQLAKVDELREITSAEPSLCKTMLRISRWNVSVAASIYFSEIARERPKLQRRNAIRGESPDAPGSPIRTVDEATGKPLPDPVDPASLAQALQDLASIGADKDLAREVITQMVCVGSKVDAQDRLGNWYSATILEAKPNQMKVGFDGWAPKHDEWIPSNSERIKPWRTMADGGKELTCDCLSCNWQRYLRAACERSEALTADLVDRIAAGEVKTTEDLEKWRRGDKADVQLRALLEVMWPSYDPEKKGRLRKKMAERLLVDYLKALSNKRVLHTVLYRMMTCTVLESVTLKYPSWPARRRWRSVSAS